MRSSIQPSQDSNDKITEETECLSALPRCPFRQSQAASVADYTAFYEEVQVKALWERLHHSRFVSSKVAGEYRNIGFRYYSIPKATIFDREVRGPTRELARTNFKISETKELPPMIQILGLLEYTLKNAATALAGSCYRVRVITVRKLLAMADIWLAEAVELLSYLQHAVNVILAMKEMNKIAGCHWYEGPKEKTVRERQRDIWGKSIPLICWEGFTDE